MKRSERGGRNEFASEGAAINYMSATMVIRVDFNFESVLCVLKSREPSLICFSRDSNRGASPEQGRRGSFRYCACEFYRIEKSRKRVSAFIFESISTLSRRVLYDFIWFYAILYDFLWILYEFI